MALSRRKSAAVALAVVGVAGLSLASAAQLNVTSSTLQAGQVAVGSCDPDGVAVSYANAFAGGVYNATGVTVSGIANECTGGQIKLTITAGSVSRELTGTVAGATFTPTTFGAAIPAADVANVAVVIAK